MIPALQGLREAAGQPEDDLLSEDILSAPGSIRQGIGRRMPPTMQAALAGLRSIY
jgi:hypothetical protein